MFLIQKNTSVVWKSEIKKIQRMTVVLLVDMYALWKKDRLRSKTYLQNAACVLNWKYVFSKLKFFQVSVGQRIGDRLSKLEVWKRVCRFGQYSHLQLAWVQFLDILIIFKVWWITFLHHFDQQRLIIPLFPIWKGLNLLKVYFGLKSIAKFSRYVIFVQISYFPYFHIAY